MRKLLILAFSSALALGMAEIVLRKVDGYHLIPFALSPANRWEAPVDHGLIERHLESMPLASGMAKAWIYEMPRAQARGEVTEELLVRSSRFGRKGVYVLNEALVRPAVCGEGRLLLDTSVKELPPDFFGFTTELPKRFSYRYRYLPNATYPTGLATQQFGWRGDTLVLGADDRPELLIAFLGASTTVNLHSLPRSYPELVEHWLSRWAEENNVPVAIRAINAGREGFKSHEVVGAALDEVFPLSPDLLVYYEGSNQFQPRRYHQVVGGKGDSELHRPRSRYRPQPTLPEEPWFIRHSVLVARVRALWILLTEDGYEAPKPGAIVEWPQTLQEEHPDLSQVALFPSELEAILSDISHLQEAARAIGSEVLLSSFVWMVEDGMVLDPVRHRHLHQYLNTTFYPFSYEHLRRYADFQNRVFETFAVQEGMPFLDVAAYVPLDPDLFLDGVHMTYEGIVLRSWITAQLLVPHVVDRLARGAPLSRPVVGTETLHPAIDLHPELRSLEALRRQCASADRDQITLPSPE